MLIVPPVMKQSTARNRPSGSLECVRTSERRWYITQLNSRFTLLATTVGQGGSGPLGFLLILDLWWSHSCAGVRVPMSVSTALSTSMDRICLSEMAPISTHSLDSLVVWIVSKIFRGHERRAIRCIFFGSLKSDCPGLGTGVQAACFQLLGKWPNLSRVSNIAGRTCGRTNMTGLTMRYMTLSAPGDEESFVWKSIFCISCVVTVVWELPQYLRGG